MFFLFSISFFLTGILLLFGFFWFFYFGGFMIDYLLFSVMGYEISFCFIFDYVSVSFFFSISMISFVVFLYSLYYMEGNLDLRRFGFLVVLFVFSMFILVFSGNFFVTMVGWDGLGLVSFCLVIFYSSSSSLNSGLITVFSNRVGDVFFLVCFFIFSVGGWWNFEFFSLSSFMSLILIFLFFGAITKSAQIPFSAWLPAAMAAPTPVSSLVHSSTLVTAGIYVIIRYHYIFDFLYYDFFKIFSIFTMLLSGICANFEKDFKKIVAMSTLSQLGFMLFVISIGCWIFSFIHMIIHAFFKSMLFLSTGSLMSNLTGSQDSRFYGNISFSYYSFLYFIVSCFCLMGFPFFIGFYSKDFIINSMNFYSGFLMFYTFLVACLFTIMYSLRLIVMGYFFMGKFFSYFLFSENWFFFIPVTFLFFKCWVMGGFFYWLFFSEVLVFFGFFDLFFGLFLIMSGVFFYFILDFIYIFSFCLSKIFFMNWFSSGGTSFLFKHMNFMKVDSSWMEFVGGGGLYKILFNVVFLFDILKKYSLGLFILVSFMLIFLFF